MKPSSSALRARALISATPSRVGSGIAPVWASQPMRKKLGWSPSSAPESFALTASMAARYSAS